MDIFTKATSDVLEGLAYVRECMKNGTCPPPEPEIDVFCAKCGFKLGHYSIPPWTKMFVLPCEHCKIETTADGTIDRTDLEPV